MRWLPISLVIAGAAACSPERSELAGGADGEEAERDRHAEEVVELAPEAAARIDIRTGEARRMKLPRVISTTGRVGFDEDTVAHVAPRVSGRVQRVAARLGERVAAGQVLAVIDSIPLGAAKSEYLGTKAELELARRTLEREEGLFEDRITSEQSVLEARAAYHRALAEHEASRERLRLLDIGDERIDAIRYGDPESALFPLTAPLGGTITDKHATLGEVVTPEDALFTVADLSRVWIWIDVYERDLAHVHLEDHVVVRVDAYPQRTFEGLVAYIRDEVDPATRTARARIDATNSEGLLKPGMFAAVTLTDPHEPEGAEAPHAVAVPEGAIQRDGERSVVFVPVGERRYERRRVETGRRTGGHVEVLEGLEAGEPVVVEGAFFLESEAAESEMGGGHGH